VKRVLRAIKRRCILPITLGLITSAVIVCWCLEGIATAVTLLVGVGTLSLALVTVFMEWVRTILLPQNLRLSVKEGLRVLTPVYRQVPDQSGRMHTQQGEAWSCSLKVVNGSRWRQAKNCRVMMMELHRQQADGTIKPDPPFTPLQLAWSIRRQTPMLARISPSGQQVDLVQVNKWGDGTLEVEFQPYVWHFGLGKKIEPGQETRCVLMIEADDFVSEPQTFEVVWDGEWSEKASEMERHLTIEEVTTEK